MRLVDTHAHLDQKEFAGDRDAVIERAIAAGVEAIVAVGTTAASSAAAVELARKYAIVFAAVGIQPNYCAEAEVGDWERIIALAREPKVVAIGETGLDRYWDYAPFAVQQDYFGRHIRLAAELNLPVVVHLRDCGVDVLEALKSAAARGGEIRGVLHSFTLDKDADPAAADFVDVAAEAVALGMHVSFAGMVTFKKSQALREIAAKVPSDRILVETDSPYLAPEPLRGKRNEPAYVVHTARRLAEVRGVALEAFAEQTTRNAIELFRFGKGAQTAQKPG
jgi:TatD DNase family protein